MNSEIQNQLNMCDACSAVLEKPERKQLWEDRKPVMFTAKVEVFQRELARLKALGKEQETPITGEAALKARAGELVEESATDLAGYLSVYFADAGKEDQLPKVNLTLSEVQRLRDQQLVQRAQMLYDLALPLTAGKNAPGVPYGIDAELLRNFQEELSIYEQLSGKPRQARATKKTQTSQVTDSSAALARMLKTLDKLIVQFRGTPAGEELVESWFNARRIDSRGHRTPAITTGADDENTAGTEDPTPRTGTNFSANGSAGLVRLPITVTTTDEKRKASAIHSSSK